MQKHDSHSDLEPVVAALRRFTSAFTVRTMEMLLRLDLTMQQARALKAIGQLGPISGRRLARELNVTPATVVPLCDRLEQLGYVERLRGKTDRRVCCLVLTPAGEEALGQRAAVHARILPVLAGLSAHERECLVRVLNALAVAIEAEEIPAGAGESGRAICS